MNAHTRCNGRRIVLDVDDDRYTLIAEFNDLAALGLARVAALKAALAVLDLALAGDAR